MMRWLALMGCALLLGCAGVEPRPPPDDTVFRDHLFGQPRQPADGDAVFALTPAMKTYLAERIQPQVRRKGSQMALLEALYTQGELRLEYDAVRTRNAAEAFDLRLGNCLSLVIMTAAFAQELGLKVRFQEVLGAAEWERNGALTFVVGHVNLALGPAPVDHRPGQVEQRWLIVDFLPGQDLGRQRTRPIDERRVRAMYMNNRAAEALARGQVNDAYWWVRSAWHQDPGFANLYNTLGVIYRHHGALAEAEQALRAARRLEPDNDHVSTNLDGVLLAQQRQRATTPMPAVAAVPEIVPATGLQRARRALDDGQLKQALRLLQGELDQSPRNHELHYWLAIANARLGDGAGARHHLELAAEFSATDAPAAVRKLYAGKLARLKAQRPGPLLQ